MEMSGQVENRRVEDGRVEVVPYEPSYHAAFRRLNEAWISRYFRIEPPDTRVLEAPQEQILDKGGHILVAVRNSEPVGVCALLRVDAETFELAKMAVAEHARGLGVGARLGESAIATARDAGALRLILESNTILTPAMALYRKLGFVEVTGAHSEYARCNIHMELSLTR
jgi:GNAT superfamily N-acetyltransferase